jgi:hypothetical protein
MINSADEMSSLISSLVGSCATYNVNYGLSTDVPAYQPSAGVCYVSASYREEKDFDCGRSAPTGKQRLCWCHSTAQQTQKVKASKEDKDGLNMPVIAAIIGGNMVFLGVVACCMWAACKCLSGGEGDEDLEPEQPGDFFARCPACGCPLNGAKAEKDIIEVTDSRPFRAGAPRFADGSDSPAIRMGDENTPKCLSVV